MLTVLGCIDLVSVHEEVESSAHHSRQRTGVFVDVFAVTV